MSSKTVGLWNVLLLGSIILVAYQKIMKFPYGLRNLLFISLTFIPYLNVYEDIFLNKFCGTSEFCFRNFEPRRNSLF